jgi:hypothetical protein
MSSTPPPPAAAVLPWEARGPDPFRAFIETVKLFATRPDEAWAMTPERGGLGNPLLFGWILTFLGLALRFVYRRVFFIRFPGILPGLPPGLREALGWGHPRSFGCAIVAFPFVGAFATVVGLFIGAVVIHVSTLIVGGARNSSSGFEGTFRVLAYSSVSSLAQIIPFVGGLISLVWWVVLAVKGIVRMHRATPGRALAAVLLPIVVCILLVVVASAALMALFVAVRHGSSFAH